LYPPCGRERHCQRLLAQHASSLIEMLAGKRKYAAG
jgi:hypothetical protein